MEDIVKIKHKLPYYQPPQKALADNFKYDTDNFLNSECIT